MKSSVFLILAGTFFFGCGTMIQSAARAQDSGLVIISPLNGAFLPQQEQTTIQAQFTPPVDLLRTKIQARVEAARVGGERFVIAEGDFRSESRDRLRAV